MLQSRMLDRMSNASRLVDKLKEKGLLIRNLNKKDRRKVDVKITAKGMKLLEKIEKSNYEDEYIKLTDAEAKKLNDLLDKLRA
jgi:DNA-binding MarR family transcriptional regulator